MAARTHCVSRVSYKIYVPSLFSLQTVHLDSPIFIVIVGILLAVFDAGDAAHGQQRETEVKEKGRGSLVERFGDFEWWNCM